MEESIMTFDKDQYDFMISDDIVIIAANDMFDDELRHNSFMLSASTGAIKNILSLLKEKASVIEVDDFSSDSGNFGTFVIYDKDGESTSIPVYECRLPENKTRMEDENEITTLQKFILDLISDYAREMDLPLNFMYTKNHRVYPKELLINALLDAHDKLAVDLNKMSEEAKVHPRTVQDDTSFSFRSFSMSPDNANLFKSDSDASE